MRPRKAIRKPVSDSCVHREGTKGEIMEDDCWKLGKDTKCRWVTEGSLHKEGTSELRPV